MVHISDNHPLTRAPRLAPGASSPKVLICCPYFYPSVGGAETIAAKLGASLVARGYGVEVLTGRLKERSIFKYLGAHILEHSGHPSDTRRWPRYTKEVRRRIVSGEYGACILFVDPENWILRALEDLEPPRGVRLVVQPLINTDGHARWSHNAKVVERAKAALRKATTVVTSTRTGIDADFCSQAGLSPVLIPNATEPQEGAPGFRQLHGIPTDSFFMLHVANFWRVKNHDGLLETFSTLRPDWRLVMIGYPSSDEEYAERVRTLASRNPSVLLIQGLSHREVVSAIRECDVVLLPSHGEVSPIVILEAMSHGKPWIATPNCGSVHETAGGLITSLERFPIAADLLHADPEVRTRLGEAGRRHWQACFQWEKVETAWIDTIEYGSHSLSFSMPKDVWDDIRAVWERASPRVGSQSAPFDSLPGVSFCIITNGTRRSKLEAEIAGIHAMKLPRYEILVGGEVSFPLDRAELMPLKEAAQMGKLGKMRNALATRARYDVLVVADDDLRFPRDFLDAIPRYLREFDALSVRIVNPDGTRFWDWAVKRPDGTGHRLLDYSEDDPYVYLTGGVCVIKAHVARKVCWSEELSSYKDEDVEFSHRLVQQGYRLGLCRETCVVHDDGRYTQAGDRVIRVTDLDWEDLYALAKEALAMGRYDRSRQFLVQAIGKPGAGMRDRIRGARLALRLKDLRAAWNSMGGGIIRRELATNDSQTLQ